VSEQKKERPKVPDGKSRYVVTRQMEANEKRWPEGLSATL
jgi:hypothetical protein